MKLSPHTRRQLGYAEGYLMLGMKEEAGEALDAIAEEEREAYLVRALRLDWCQACEAWEEAAALGQALCAERPGEAGHWIQWAYAVRRAEGVPSAREILLSGLKQHACSAIMHYNLACYEAQLGHLEAARKWLEAACSLDGQFTTLAKTDPDLEPLGL